MIRLSDLSRIAVAALSTAVFICAGAAPVALSPALAPAALAAGAPAEPPADLRQAVAALRAIATLRADFVQISGSGQRTSGVLSLKRPGKIRFQYAPGVPMLIVGDGRALTVIDTEVKQVQRWPISSSPLGALLDPGRDVFRYGTLLPTLDHGMVVIEVRDRAHPEFGVVTLVLARKPSAPGGMELTGWSTLDAQNRRTVIRLSNQQYGVPLSDELFRYLDIRARPHH